jgi:hypothetical protein
MLIRAPYTSLESTLLNVVLHASQTADSGKNNSSWRKARLQAQELTLVVVENRECMLDGESDAKT